MRLSVGPSTPQLQVADQIASVKALPRATTDRLATFCPPLRLRRPIDAPNSIDLAALPRRRRPAASPGISVGCAIVEAS
jgi:hypothetical protein